MLASRLALLTLPVCSLSAPALGLIAESVGPEFAPPAAFAYRAMGATAHHGPGTSGGGSSTLSGETLRPGTFELSLRTDYTHFESFSREEAEDQAAQTGEFDAIDWSLLTTASLSMGVAEDLQIGLAWGYYLARGFVSAEPTEDGVESGAADPDGFTDLWITAKVRVMKGQPGNLAILAGVKLPTGRHDVTLDNGERLDASSQPGTGAVDFQAGLGYSRFLTSRITIDASVAYTFRTAHDGFTVGDRVDAGVAVAYRLTEDIAAFPQWSVFGEINGVMITKDESDDEGENDNTGGESLFFTPGVRVRFNPALALTLAPTVPVVQELNGTQDETRFKFAATLSWSF